MIRLEKLGFQYGVGAPGNAQLCEIDLHVKPGEFILLTGASGCGKTTLTRVLNGLCPQFYPGTVTGTYQLCGRDAADIPVNELGTLVGSVFQDPRSQFYATGTTDEIVLGMENNAVPREEMQMRLAEAVALVGLENLLDRPIFPLSSGEKQRVAIASVCAMQPRVLVLDEPSANLDSDAIARLGLLLFRLKEAGTTIILSEHRLHYVRDCFDRMVIMENGCIKSEFTQSAALALSQTQLEQYGLRSFAQPSMVPGKRNDLNEAAKLYGRELSIAFDGHRILDEVSFSVDNGHILAITGGNGAGKSSLCRVVTGLYKQNIGQVMMDGLALKKKKRVRGVFFVQQDTDYQLYAATVEDEFHIGRQRKPLDRAQIIAVLRDVGLEDMLDRHPLSLSGGQKQRLLLALALASGKEILVLDEPTSGLDGHNMHLIASLLQKLAQQGKCILLITHDLELVELACDSLLYMDKGKSIYQRTILSDS